MRRNILMRSVAQVLGGNVRVDEAAYVWTRHRWTVPFSASVFVGIVVLAPIGGVIDWPARIALGLAGVAVAVLATTDYRVVAQTENGFAIFEASRIRQVAKALEKPLGGDPVIEPIGGTIIYTDWRIGEASYTAPRSSQKAMERMAAAVA